jgi:hypothetical protein
LLTLDLDRRFPVVVLASNFINEVEAESRRAFLACCARHVRLDGQVLLQGFPRGWTATSDWWEQGDVRGRPLPYTLDLAAVGLRGRRRLDPRGGWIEAVPAAAER